MPGENNISFLLTGKRSYLILIGACLLLYGNTLFNDYSWDDDVTVFNNSLVQKGIKGIPAIITSFYTFADGIILDYRPVATITYAIEKEFFDNNPHISHLLNVFIYAVLILIIFSVLNEIFQVGKLHYSLPLVITLLYIVHPAHTEVVASIKNREEMLCMLFAMLALLHSNRLYLNGRVVDAVAAMLFMALSLLSKKTAVPMIGVMLLLWYHQGFQWKKPFVIFIISLIVLSVIYFAVFISKTAKEFSEYENPLNDLDGSLRIGSIFQTLLFYLKFMLYPYPFRYHYWQDLTSFLPALHPLNLLSFLLHLVILIYGILEFRKRTLIGFFILAYLGNIFLFSNVIPNPVVFSERSLFMPSLWFIAAVILFIYKVGRFEKSGRVLHSSQKLIITLGAIVFLAFAGLTVHRNSQWRDYLTLLASDTPHMKNSALANYWYATSLSDESRKTSSPELREKYISLAKKHFRQVIQIKPTSNAYFNLGMIYEYAQQNRDSAFICFSIGYSADPSNNPMKFQLAKQYYLRGNYSEAERLFSSLYEALPGDTFTLYFYSLVLFESDKDEKAFAVNTQLMNLAPGLFHAYANFGSFYQDRGDTLRAVENFEKAVQLGCRYEEVYDYLLNYYLSTGQNEKQKQLMAVFDSQLRGG